MTETPFTSCERLFARYPLAVNDHGGMTLIVPGSKPQFYVLVKAKGTYDLCRWRGHSIVLINPFTVSVPATCENALAAGVPLPRAGTLFGWTDAGEVTAVIGSHADQQQPLPTFSVAVRPGTPATRQPPDYPVLGNWFWDAYQAGQVINLARLIAGTAGLWHWSARPGEGVIAVTSTIEADVTVPAGVYARTGLGRAPGLADVLTDPRRIDLGPRFAR